jgi:molybdate/tungstate transport system substrate-binding protein
MFFKGGYLVKSRITEVSSIALVLILALTLMVGCAKEGEISRTETLRIYHAGSLYQPFKDLEAEFEVTHPSVDVLCESGGSAKMINKAIAREQAGELPPDIIASADYKLIPDRLYEPGYADWYIAFARNAMVLCYHDGALGSEDIVGGTRTWYDVLRNDPVKYGHSNPDDDPCGYRTPLVIQLAQKYYYDEAAKFGLTPDTNADGLYDALTPGNEHERGRVGGVSEIRPSGSEESVRSKSVELIHLLDSGDLDYAFEYRSVAVQHGLNFIELDDHVNLSKTSKELPGLEDFYQEASIEIVKEAGPPPTYKAKKGKPIVYGITIPLHAENKELAVEFIKLLLSDAGRNIVEVKNGQPFIVPVLTDDTSKLPDELKSNEIS